MVSIFFLKDVCGLCMCLFFFQGMDSLYNFDRKATQDYIFNLLKKIPLVRKHLEGEFKKFHDDFEKSLKPAARAIEATMLTLPLEGRTNEDILTLMRSTTAGKCQMARRKSVRLCVLQRPEASGPAEPSLLRVLANEPSPLRRLAQCHEIRGRDCRHDRVACKGVQSGSLRMHYLGWDGEYYFSDQEPP